MKNKIDVIVGEIFRDRRIDLRLSQAQLGEKVGMPQSTYACYEKGLRGMSLETYFALCEALHLDPNEVHEEVKKQLDDNA